MDKLKYEIKASPVFGSLPQDRVAGKHGGCNRGDGRFRHFGARRLINSSRDGVSADLIRIPSATGREAVLSLSLLLFLFLGWLSHYYPAYTEGRRVPQGSLVPRGIFQGWDGSPRPPNVSFPILFSSLTPSSPRLYHTPPRFSSTLPAFVVATLFSGEIPRSAIYIFDVASSTPLMLLVRNLPLTCVPRCSFALRFPPLTSLSPSGGSSFALLSATWLRHMSGEQRDTARSRVNRWNIVTSKPLVATQMRNMHGMR